MWSNAWILVCLVVVTTEGHPYNDRKLHQNEVKVGPPYDHETKVQNDARENSDGGLDSDKRHSAKQLKKVPATPVVDDDLLEFLVRVADNPAEWNKIRRVLSMLGRDETGTTTGADYPDATTAAVTPTRAPTQDPAVAADVPSGTAAARPADGARHLHQPRYRDGGGPAAAKSRVAALRAPPPTPVPGAVPGPTSSRASWPQAEWIRQTAESIEAARRGDYYYDEDEDDDDDDDDDDGGDGSPLYDGGDGGELVVLDGAPPVVLSPPPGSRRRGTPVTPTPPCRSPDDDGCPGGGGGGGAHVNVVESAAPADDDVIAACCSPSVPRPHTPRPVPRRAAGGGHMSRYQFKRIDGGPDDGSGVNGTYVAVVEDDDDDDNGPPR